MLAKRARPPILILLVMASSVLFFLVTNFAVWAASSWYPPTFEGLIASYIAGLPFLRNMFIGDVFYAASLLGVFEWIYTVVRHRTQGTRVGVVSSETAVI